MTIYEIELQPDVLAEIEAIMSKSGYIDSMQRRKDNEALTRIYLRYIENWHWKPHERNYEPTLQKWLSCGRCINKVLEYFETRFGNEWQ